ncbi:MAG: galactonate dehydratase [Candidatus Solibacter usitatus]|nr:galactonate dehydratase [Candidatus Solibacter usitatus]
MIIRKIETVQVAPRWGLLRVLTDQDGLEGYGEYTVEGQLGAAEAAVGEMAESFVGREAGEIKRLVRGCYDRNFYHGGAHYMSALGGIEIALWDLAGKAAGLPVHRLLGGKVRDRVKVYRWAGGNNNSAAAAAEEAAKVVAEGARAIKMNACPPLAAVDTYGGIRTAVERARAVREAVGENVDIAFDFHGRANVPMARRLAKELEFAHPLFYEEPVRPEYNRWLKEVAEVTHVPIATGERMTTVAEFSDVAAARSAHILQPDVVHVGGISNTAEVAALCEANGLAVAPHCPLSPIAFMACLHVVAQSRAGWILEWAKGIHYNASGATGECDPWLRYVDERDWPLFDLDHDGHMAIPETPGLGVRVNWAEVEKAARAGVAWRDESMYLPDGTLTNW